MAKKTTEKLPRPLYNMLIIDAEKRELRTQGGIIIPSTAAQNEHRGTILAMGPLVNKDTQNNLKVGDTVQFNEHAGIKFEYGNREYLVMKEPDLMFVL